MIRLCGLALCVSLAMQGAGFQKVAEGNAFWLFLQDNGAILAFGQCYYGNLTQTDCQQIQKPIAVPLPRPAVDIAAAKWSGFAVLDDGTVYSWGSDEEGVLGRALDVPRRPSVKGSPTPGPVVGLPKAKQIYAASQSVAVLTESGELWMWGIIYNNRRDNPTKTLTPKRIEGLPPLAGFSMNERTFPGVMHMLAVGRDGSLWAWGYNNLGQLGDGTKEASPVPKRIDLPAVVSAAAGGNNSVAVLADGTVRVWGANDSSTMGNGENVQGAAYPLPKVLPGVSGAVSVSAGYGHIAVLLKNGTMRTWGHDGWGQAGVGTSGGYQMRPGAPKLSGVTAVYMVLNRCFAITTGGRLWFWGPGDRRVLGVMKVDQHVPAEVSGW